ncbi:MAG: RNA polymerase factor sigma-54 [Moraxella sp.]|nr:RNA polymerase factor sigma-54 [Moraxella sp.]
MSMSFGLGVNLNTTQKLTPQMQQAIKLLQLSSLELEQEVQLKLDSNPLLERENDEDMTDTEELSLDDWAGNTYESTAAASTDGFDDYGSEDTLDKLEKSSLDSDAIDSDWTSVYADTHDDWGSPSGENGEDTEFLGATSACIQDHVRWQINFHTLSDLDKLIAEHLIDSMDDAGFIRTSLDEIAMHFATMLSFYQAQTLIDVHAVVKVLQIIQSCSPTGVGARSLDECLMLQLNELDDNTEYLAEARMVLGCAHHLQSNNIKALIQETGLDSDEIKAAIDLIRTLDPSPATSFIEHGTSHQTPTHEQVRDIPDVLVFAKDRQKKRTIHAADADSWRVMLNPETLPRLRINQEYANLIKRGDDSTDNLYLKNNLSDAKLFIRSIEERNQNLLKVATCIVQKQQGFLLSGAMMMQPLTLKDVAEVVDLHESTVSRLTTNKSILTPQGLFSLKYFFSSHVTGQDGEVSSTAISAMIEEMIKNENPKKPLSDSAITQSLEAKGLSISRRTVTKYREAMGIGSSTERRKKL